jgi:ATP synthase F1 complex assembly factor 1
MQLTTQEQEKLQKFAKVIEENSYYAKYKAKIMNLQRSSPQAFLALVDQLLSSGKKYADTARPKQKTFQNRKKLVLDDIMKLSSLLSLDRQDICFIWTEYHKGTQMVAAVMSGSKYESIIKRAEAYSSFVLPLPREENYVFFLAQYGDDSFYLTPLADYHKFNENSPVCLTLSHFDELRSTKDLVLLRGEFDKDVISLKEAQYLAVELNCYYGEDNERRLELMKNFNENPSSFQHMNLIAELRSLESEYSDVFPKLK